MSHMIKSESSPHSSPPLTSRPPRLSAVPDGGPTTHEQVLSFYTTAVPSIARSLTPNTLTTSSRRTLYDLVTVMRTAMCLSAPTTPRTLLAMSTIHGFNKSIAISTFNHPYHLLMINSKCASMSLGMLWRNIYMVKHPSQFLGGLLRGSLGVGNAPRFKKFERVRTPNLNRTQVQVQRSGKSSPNPNQTEPCQHYIHLRASGHSQDPEEEHCSPFKKAVIDLSVSIIFSELDEDEPMGDFTCRLSTPEIVARYDGLKPEDIRLSDTEARVIAAIRADKDSDLRQYVLTEQRWYHDMARTHNQSARIAALESLLEYHRIPLPY
ncbi:hypothetical protein B0H11DRAFT_1909709 [Mycena galericulata]|nr:hypothetical protein B0H11DRAFT_1909709 [Mycena galericulata]